MNEKEISDFVQSYSKNSFKKIKCNLTNEDKNYGFREMVSDYVVKNPEEVNDQLILDLYSEWSKSSQITWDVYFNFHLLAQALFDRGGTKFLMEYLKGASKTYDTLMSSNCIKISEELNEAILEKSKKALENDPDKEIRSLWELAIERFEKKDN